MAPALLRAAIARALAREGVSRVRLFVHKDNGRAEAFYCRSGFERTRVVGEEYEMEYRRAADPGGGVEAQRVGTRHQQCGR